MADVNGVLKIEMGSHRREIVGVMIHVVAVARLGRSAVAAAIMSDHAVALLDKKQHLRVPVIGRERPAVAEHDGLTFAPILVEDFNAVFRRDETHVYLLKLTSSVRMSVVESASGGRTFIRLRKQAS